MVQSNSSSSRTHPIVLVTGGSRGIGRAICIEFAKHGYEIMVNYRTDEAAAKETLDIVSGSGGSGRILCFDVTDAAQTESVLGEMLRETGGVDVLVNNAGITADGLFMMMSHENWNRVIQTSLDGFYNVTRPVIEKMVRRKKGSIVSISSVSGLMANRGQANYAAAKAGIIGASRALAAEVARLGIRVNVVAPGLIETDMIKAAPVENIKTLIPMARVGKPEEVAKVVRFLCSEDASYVTGQVVGVNGGMA